MILKFYVIFNSFASSFVILHYTDLLISAVHLKYVQCTRTHARTHTRMDYVRLIRLLMKVNIACSFCLCNVLPLTAGIQISSYVIVSICRDVPALFVAKETVSGGCEIIVCCLSVLTIRAACVRLEVPGI